MKEVIFKIDNDILDIAFNFLPRYINNMKGYIINEFVYDIGTIEKLDFANAYVMKHTKEFEIK